MWINTGVTQIFTDMYWKHPGPYDIQHMRGGVSFNTHWVLKDESTRVDSQKRNNSLSHSMKLVDPMVDSTKNRTISWSHSIHVLYIYLHLVDLYGKCRQIYHTWILWGFQRSRDSIDAIFMYSFILTTSTLPETNSSPMKIPIFPGNYHENGGFSNQIC